MGSLRALNWKPDEVEKQERRHREELATTSEKHNIKLEAAKKRIGKLEGAEQKNETSKDTKRETAKCEPGDGSGGSINSNDSLEVKRPTPKKRKGRLDIRELCCIMN